ncbi:MAG TPA: hypothetical protein VFC79_09185, partial [Tissierellaceae bacterium]|nr:hypothetical protein [Tissierellaceae bacterium]
ILMQLNLPYIHETFETALENNLNDPIGDYFRMLNSLPQNKGLTWESSIFEGSDEVDVTDKVIDEAEDVPSEIERELSKFTIKQLEDRWGLGYDEDKLYLFEKKYLMLKNHYNEKTAMHTEALLNYIRYRVQEEVSTAEGNVGEAKAWGALASKAATDAKINPSQLSKADLSDGLSTFSELSQAVEKEVDIIRILPKFKYRPNDALDFNIWCYINYSRELSGLPSVDYEDIYAFYDKKIEEYVEQYGDPYGIFEDDTSIKNRESIKKFIKDGDE